MPDVVQHFLNLWKQPPTWTHSLWQRVYAAWRETGENDFRFVAAALDRRVAMKKPAAQTRKKVFMTARVLDASTCLLLPIFPLFLYK